MPVLKDLNCWVEADGQLRFREYATAYGDSAVETFIAIPDNPGTFVIKLQNNKFVWSGLAVLVFIDGVKQCVRVKSGMVDDRKDPTKWQKTFTLKKKEEFLSTKDGRSLDRTWKFEKLNLVDADTASVISFETLDNVGIIEVIVLRCEDRAVETLKEPAQDQPNQKASDQPNEKPKANVGEKPFNYWTLPLLTQPKQKEKVVAKHVSKGNETTKKGREKESSNGMLGGLFDGTNDERDATDSSYSYRRYSRARDRSQIDRDYRSLRSRDREQRPYARSFDVRRPPFVFDDGTRLRVATDDNVPRSRRGADRIADDFARPELPRRAHRSYYDTPEPRRAFTEQHHYPDEFDLRSEYIERRYSPRSPPHQSTTNHRHERTPAPAWDFRDRYRDDEYIQRPQGDRNAEHVRRCLHKMKRAGAPRVPSRSTFDEGVAVGYNDSEDNSDETIIQRGRYRGRSRSRSVPRRENPELQESLNYITQKLEELATATKKDHGCCRRCSFPLSHALKDREILRIQGGWQGLGDRESGSVDRCPVHARYDQNCCRCNGGCLYCDGACRYVMKDVNTFNGRRRNADSDSDLSSERTYWRTESHGRNWRNNHHHSWSPYYHHQPYPEGTWAQANDFAWTTSTPTVAYGSAYGLGANFSARPQVVIGPDGQEYDIGAQRDAIDQAQNNQRMQANSQGGGNIEYQQNRSIVSQQAAVDDPWATNNQEWGNVNSTQTQQQGSFGTAQDSSQGQWNSGQQQDANVGGDVQQNCGSASVKKSDEQPNPGKESENQRDGSSVRAESKTGTQNSPINGDWDNKSASKASKTNGGTSKKKSDPVRPSAAAISRARSYWAGPSKAPVANTAKHRTVFYADRTPKILKADAESRHIEHQVRPGPAVEGKHRVTTSIRYKDGTSEPYAVFRFKYRSADKLREILGKDDFKESLEELKLRLKNMTAEQVVAEYVQATAEKQDKSRDNFEVQSEPNFGDFDANVVSPEW